MFKAYRGLIIYRMSAKSFQRMNVPWAHPVRTPPPPTPEAKPQIRHCFPIMRFQFDLESIDCSEHVHDTLMHFALRAHGVSVLRHHTTFVRALARCPCSEGAPKKNRRLAMKVAHGDPLPSFTRHQVVPRDHGDRAALHIIRSKTV